MHSLFLLTVSPIRDRIIVSVGGRLKPLLCVIISWILFLHKYLGMFEHQWHYFGGSSRLVVSVCRTR